MNKGHTKHGNWAEEPTKPDISGDSRDFDFGSNDPNRRHDRDPNDPMANFGRRTNDPISVPTLISP